jgi:hypothetical protein
MNEQLAFWINLFASSTAIMGLFFVAFELYRNRQAEVRQFHFDTFKMFSIDMKQDRFLENKFRLNKSEDFATQIAGDYETGQAIKNVLDFYTLLAAAAREKTINQDKAIEYWGQSVISFWTKYGPILVKRRELMGPQAFKQLE